MHLSSLPYKCFLCSCVGVSGHYLAIFVCICINFTCCCSKSEYWLCEENFRKYTTLLLFVFGFNTYMCYKMLVTPLISFCLLYVMYCSKQDSAVGYVQFLRFSDDNFCFVKVIVQCTCAVPFAVATDISVFLRAEISIVDSNGIKICCLFCLEDCRMLQF